MKPISRVAEPLLLQPAPRQCVISDREIANRFKASNRRGVGVPEKPEHPGGCRRSPQDLSKHNADNGALHAVARRNGRSDILEVIIESCERRFIDNPA